MYRIKHSYLFLVLLFIGNSLWAQESNNLNRTIFIVRHAEKDTGSNPAISQAGMVRAGDLYRQLKNKNIQLVMVSQYRRTGMTGDSLRIYKRIDSMHYMADATGNDLFARIAALPASIKNILIVGHSNTVPVIIRKAGVTAFELKELPDNEYDNLYIVKQRKGKIKLIRKKYGRPSGPANNGKMNILQ